MDTIISSNASQLYQYIEILLNPIQYITDLFGVTVYDEQTLTRLITIN